MTPAEIKAIETLLYREHLKQDFEAFCRHALKPLGQEPQPHHLMIIKALQELAETPYGRLIITAPPGHAKSTYASVLFPAWFMSRAPRQSFIGASYNSDLADRFSIFTRRTIEDNRVVLDYGLREDTRAKERWETTNGGEYRSAGMNAGITGFRADCLTGDTLVNTPKGSLSIKDAINRSEPFYVLSFNEESKNAEYRRAIAIARRRADGYFRITTSSGIVVQATENHQFYTERGWSTASSLVVGDVLMRSMQQALPFESLRGEEAVRAQLETITLLQQVLFNESEQRCERDEGSQDVPVVQRGFASQGSEEETVLFAGTSEPTRQSEGVGEAEAIGRDYLSSLWRDLHAPILHQTDNVFEGMWWEAAFPTHQGSEKPWLSPWHGIRPDESEILSHSEEEGSQAGWTSVRDLRGERESPRTSYRFESNKSRDLEPRNSLSGPSHGPSCGGTVETVSDSVSMVEWVCEGCDVFDIQVEENHNFFANGILVHNCVIIDDPHRNLEEAYSPTLNEKVWNVYITDIITRLKGEGKIVLILTRWADNDLAGRILEIERERWKVLRLPAIAEEDDILGRKPGEALWPEQWPIEKLQQTRLIQGERHFSALFQGRPQPLHGNLIQIDKLQKNTVQKIDPERIKETVRAYDLAAGVRRDADYTVGVKMARLDNGSFAILDVLRFRGEPQDVEAAILATAKKDGSSCKVSLPIDPGAAGKQSNLYMTRSLAGYHVDSSRETGDKVTRAMPVTSQINVGNVHMIEAGWNLDFLDELASFPGGKHDDQVDALSRAFNALMIPSKPAQFVNLPFMLR